MLDPAVAATSARVAAKSEERFVAAWARWVAAYPSVFYREDMRMATGYSFYRSAVSMLRHSQVLVERYARLPVPGKGYILGGLSEPHGLADAIAALT